MRLILGLLCYFLIPYNLEPGTGFSDSLPRSTCRRWKKEKTAPVCQLGFIFCVEGLLRLIMSRQVGQIEVLFTFTDEAYLLPVTRYTFKVSMYTFKETRQWQGTRFPGSSCHGSRRSKWWLGKAGKQQTMCRNVTYCLPGSFPAGERRVILNAGKTLGTRLFF